MSDAQNEVNNLWKDYVGSLAKWKLAFELWQKAGLEAMQNYNKAIKTSNANMLPNSVSDTMQNTWMESGLEQIKQFKKEWDNMVKASGLESMQYFGDHWQKFWSSMEPTTNYSQAVKQFTESWQKMWKK